MERIFITWTPDPLRGETIVGRYKNKIVARVAGRHLEFHWAIYRNGESQHSGTEAHFLDATQAALKAFIEAERKAALV